jgi:hypothetical protein
VINISSILGLRQDGKVVPYAVSKAAAVQFTKIRGKALPAWTRTVAVRYRTGAAFRGFIPSIAISGNVTRTVEPHL